MVFKPIENRKISSRIMEQIKENILRGKLRVGDKLVRKRIVNTIGSFSFQCERGITFFRYFRGCCLSYREREPIFKGIFKIVCVC